MIPLRLHIKNFLSYGSTLQTINFEPYHLICLSGKNGHGKSSLLDAITWSLWGQARKTTTATKSDEGLLRLGQSDMLVALDFVCNGASYRVRREYCNVKGKTGTHLDFGILDTDTGKLRQLTEKTMRDTQDKINKTIGMDFSAFENSVFLRQGHADAFSRQTPPERKETLANILGLGTYENIRKQAIEKGKEAARLQQQSEKICELLSQNVSQHTAITRELHTTEQQYTEVITQENALLQEQEGLLTQQKQSNTALQQHQRQLAELEHASQGKKACEQSLRELCTSWRAINKKQRAHQHAIKPPRSREMIIQELETLQKRAALKALLLAEITTLKEQLHQRTVQVQERYFAQQQEQRIALQQHEQQVALLEKEYKAKQAEYGTLQLLAARAAEQYQAACKAHMHCETMEKELKSGEQALEFMQRKLNRCSTHEQRIRQEAAAADTVVQQLATCSAVCSACLQAIPPTQHTYARNKAESLISRKAHQLRRIGTVLTHYQQTIATQQLRLRSLKEALHKETVHAAHFTAQSASQKEYESRCAEQVTAIEATMASRHNAQHAYQAFQQTMNTSTTSTALIAHDPACLQLQQELVTKEQMVQQAHQEELCYQTLQEELARYAQYETERTTLLHERERQNERRQQIHDAIQKIRALRHICHTLREIPHSIALQTSQLQTCELRLNAVQVALTTLRQQKEEIVSKKGALDQAIKHIDQQTQLLKKEKQLLRSYQEEVQDYVILAQALSKDGIQGMLIEHILPEIEREANALLAKLTDNQSHLRFESVRELKNGSAKETLEIKIADSLGVRPYELFSGGEAFRIDFALRLAISKLLARRAGASIQTLIIDEGFGSQDEEGLNHIMESLYAIQNEFAKIIIVSHLSSMKDQFPIHFHVSKSARGSVVQIIQQG